MVTRNSNSLAFYCLAMVPEFWLTEGGQSATGALVDYMVENHVASSSLSSRAASLSKTLFPK